MSKFQRFPEMLTNDDGVSLIVNDEAEFDQALADGFKTAPGESSASPATTEDVAALKADLAAAEELITKLDEAGAKVTSERDEALKALEAANAEIATLKAAKKADPLDHDGDGKKGGAK